MKKRSLLMVALSTCMIMGCNRLPKGLQDNSKVDFLIDKEDIKENIDRDFYDNSFNDERIANQWTEYGIGDPFVYRFNGMYYLYCSTKNSQVGVRAYKSNDLIHWTPVNNGVLAEGYVSEEECTLTAYAPEITYLNGKFYMCESQSGNGHYMLESDSPEGPFVKTQDNFGESIDGTFFIDDDETVYFLRASSSGIRMIKMNDDMTVSTNAKRLATADIGGWTEGPSLIKKDGTYFLMFTGNSVISTGYRVGYAYHNDLVEADMFDRDGYYYGDNLLLCTDEDFNGLGHSSAVMGPNMDSYYIAYHSLESSAGPKRRFCINRLMFNGSEMVVPQYGLHDNIAPQMPEFSATSGAALEASGSLLLSNKASEDIFTAEFNFIGANPKCIFSYVDESNYNYITVSDANKVEIKAVKAGQESSIASYSLKKSYNYTKLHTLRVSYSDGILDGFFDNMNIIKKVNATLVGGKIGYANIEASNVHYTAFSNAAHDSSQQDDYKQNVITANSFDRKYSTVTKNNLVKVEEKFPNNVLGSNYLKFNKNTATYKIYVKESGFYGVDMRLSQTMQGKTCQLRIDNEPYQNFKVTKFEKGDDEYCTHVGGLAISKGVHYLTVSGELGFEFRDLSFYLSSNKEETFTHALDDFVTKGVNYVNTWKLRNGGHYALSGNRQLLLFGHSGIVNASAEVTINLDGATLSNSAGIVLRASNASFSNGEYTNSIQGFYVGFNNSKIFITECNYNLTKTGVADAMKFESGRDYVLKAEVIGNTVKCYIDGELMLTYVTEVGPVHGSVGLYTDGAAATYKNLSIKVMK